MSELIVYSHPTDASKNMRKSMADLLMHIVRADCEAMKTAEHDFACFSCTGIEKYMQDLLEEPDRYSWMHEVQPFYKLLDAADISSGSAAKMRRLFEQQAGEKPKLATVQSAPKDCQNSRSD